MDSQQRVLLPKGSEQATYAQTLQRDGYINMLGRPPFNYSAGSPMRSAGFLSTGNLLDSTGKTIFKSCKTLRQCFTDTFTHLGLEHTRRAYVESGALAQGSPAFMRDWQPSDATKCGIFGIWLYDENGKGVNRMCPGTTDATHYCCALDVAVAPLFYLFNQVPSALDELEPVCNRPFSPFGASSDSSYMIFSKQKVLTAVKQIGRSV